MPRILQLAAVLALFALAAASAQQPESPAKPAQQAPPRSAHLSKRPRPWRILRRLRPRRSAACSVPHRISRATRDARHDGYTVGRRVFEAGARNATWHMHTAGQLVFGEAGRGRLQIQGQPIKELGVGDSAFIPGGTYHWHGAAPNENFTMMFITMGQSKTSQGDPVTEEVYRGRGK